MSHRPTHKRESRPSVHRGEGPDWYKAQVIGESKPVDLIDRHVAEREIYQQHPGSEGKGIPSTE